MNQAGRKPEGPQGWVSDRVLTEKLASALRTTRVATGATLAEIASRVLGRRGVPINPSTVDRWESNQSAITLGEWASGIRACGADWLTVLDDLGLGPSWTREVKVHAAAQVFCRLHDDDPPDPKRCKPANLDALVAEALWAEQSRRKVSRRTIADRMQEATGHIIGEVAIARSVPGTRSKNPARRRLILDDVDLYARALGTNWKAVFETSEAIREAVHREMVGTMFSRQQNIQATISELERQRDEFDQLVISSAVESGPIPMAYQRAWTIG